MNTFLKRNSPLLVGLTGGIGSGKTTVSKIFNVFGVKVFNSDNVAKNLLNTNNEIRKEVIELFGDVYENNLINAKKLASIVFNNSELINKLNQVIHPRVNLEFIEWVKNNNQEKLLLKESAILIESGGHNNLDQVILVVSDECNRISRVVKRDNSTKSAVLERINKQLTDEEKIKFSNYIIYNNDKDLLIPQIEDFLNKFNYSSSSSSSSSSSE
ncbi:dephospho-CoA kinase [Vicingus serpentipes]|uniref:Dephospho-CoA kinase n=1 Tax=Vicingus serpentipes TaxID=1926625 RepID=A0A5C6RVW1_9FLAO|nr:dephospho-CoA kinase [Vicingus serpentipes]TXB66686.1 dephospho-CoA kinase [Vicingus serpentipes]